MVETQRPDDEGSDTGENTYEEREAVAIFASEAALNEAVDALMQVGWRQGDFSLLDAGGRTGRWAEDLADSDDAPRAAYVSDDSRTEGMAATVAGPALLAGLGTAALATVPGAALAPVIALTAGGAALAGGIGLLFARAFGRRHAEAIRSQIADGGLLLWVRAPDPNKDALLLSTLRRSGGRSVHLHVATRHWGVEEVPFHDAQPDPLLR